MQAMACGIPVVTTPVGSIDEIVEAGVTGVLVPPQNEVRLRVELANLLADAPRREALGTQAAALARERFADTLMVDRMLQVFTEVAQRRG
jgi:glycosyltransferase involved in cell wall biosynthesis